MSTSAVPAPEPQKPIGWRRLFIRAAGFGAGLAITLFALGGLAVWWSSRPKPPKPWDTRAITAQYDYILPEGDKNDLAFHYTLQNNTDEDFRIVSEDEIDVSAKLKREQAISKLGVKNMVTLDYPIFIPARNRVFLTLTIGYQYPTKEPDELNADGRKQFRNAVAKYVTDELPNINGFVIFDSAHRYEIDFPSGWEPAEPAKKN